MCFEEAGSCIKFDLVSVRFDNKEPSSSNNLVPAIKAEKTTDISLLSTVATNF